MGYAAGIIRSQTIAALLLSWIAITPATAQEIVTTRWGFDGRVVLNRFNLFSAELRNPTSEPIDKELQFSKMAVGRLVGAPIVQRCFLSPGARRWVHFHPFIASASESWRLSWVGGGADGQTAPGLRPGIGAVVLLEEEPTESSRRLRVPAFPPEHLPSFPEAMGALRALVMDHIPDLSGAQRVAMREWVRRGGEIHLLQGSRGHPRFRGDLSELHGERRVSHFGGGKIYRHGFDRYALRTEFPTELWGDVPPQRLPTTAIPLAQDLRAQLKSSITLDHSWALIFALTLIYIVLIGPVFFRLSTERLSWPIGLATLAGLIAMATWLFQIVGARGYGEQDLTHSWSFARPAGEGRYEVTRFVDVFVTQGGDYAFDGGGAAFTLFSSAQDRERVNGRIVNGTAARYTVDMPQFSHRLVIAKNTVAGPDAGIGVLEREFFTTLDFTRVISVRGTSFISWQKVGAGHWRLARALPISDRHSDYALSETTLEHVAMDRMQLHALDPDKNATARGHQVFFCEGPTPPEFRLHGGGPGVGLGRERGRTVYRFDSFQ